MNSSCFYFDFVLIMFNKLTLQKLQEYKYCKSTSCTICFECHLTKYCYYFICQWCGKLVEYTPENCKITLKIQAAQGCFFYKCKGHIVYTFSERISRNWMEEQKKKK